MSTTTNSILLALGIVCFVNCKAPNDPGLRRYQERSANVTIVRDTWGIPHVYGKSDVDAVFGLMYAQCEESFERIERNYLQRFGRMAELEGQAYLATDLQMRLLYDTAIAKTNYQQSPEWLKALCIAFADGINFYLYKHPETKPALLNHFEPWFAFLFTDGAYVSTQVGGLQNRDLEELYKIDGTEPSANTHQPLKTIGANTGSNGFALAPSKTLNGKSLLYINPHVTFDFRMEAHMVSEEGLNAYGAVTWGQFFIFQGFNEHCGWMHTSSMADASDLYEEKIIENGDSVFYRYGDELKHAVSRQHTLHCKTPSGRQTRNFTSWQTIHGPVMGSRQGRWLTLKANHQPAKGLLQSWMRTKSAGIADFKKSMENLSNTSTNTLYADGAGNIAYWHGNFIPRRDTSYDCSAPLDGSTPATAWKGTHTLDEIVHIINPASGWIQNCNSSPFTGAGAYNFPQPAYPAYMAPEGENFRSVYAIRTLNNPSRFSLEELIRFGNSRYLSAFDSTLPALLKDLASLPASTESYHDLIVAADTLAAWDKNSATSSVATTLSILWMHTLLNTKRGSVPAGNDEVKYLTSLVNSCVPQERIGALLQVIKGLDKVYGSWKIPWGQLNRYQRSAGIHPVFDDKKESLPMGAASSMFGSLPAYETDWSQTNRGYGFAGNSFVAAIEFGSRLRAYSIVPGGQSFKPGAKHFDDQAQQYLNGRFKAVFFYREDVMKHQESAYHPGENQPE